MPPMSERAVRPFLSGYTHVLLGSSNRPTVDRAVKHIILTNAIKHRGNWYPRAEGTGDLSGTQKNGRIARLTEKHDRVQWKKYPGPSSVYGFQVGKRNHKSSLLVTPGS